MEKNKMENQEIRIDLRIPDEKRHAEGVRTEELLSEINQLTPRDPKLEELEMELFHMEKGSRVQPPVYCNLAENVTIGKDCVIMPYSKMMSAGKITIEDHVRIALNVSLLTNNHDPYQREVLTVKNIYIKEGAWIGAGSIILPGVTVGRYAIVGAGSVVVHDVADYEVVAGNPARRIRMLDPEKFDGNGEV